MQQIHIWYIVGVVVYAAVIIGVSYMRRVRSYEAFMLAERKTPLLTGTLGLIGVSYGGFVITSFVMLGFLMGFSGTWAWTTSIVSSVVFGMLLAPILRKRVDTDVAHSYTTGDFYAHLFGERMRIPTMVLITFRDISVVGMECFAGGLILNAVVGFPIIVGMLISAGVILAYTILGGYVAINITTNIQAIFFSAGAVTLMVLAFMTAGGWGNIVANAPAVHFEWFNLTPDLWQFWLITMSCFYLMWFPFWQRAYSAKDVKIVRPMFGIGMPLVGVIFFVAALTGIALSAVYPGANPAIVGPWFISQLPSLYGTAGVILAVFIFTSVLAALQSTGAGTLIGPTLLITHDIFRMRLGITDEKKLFRIGRFILLPAVLALSFGLSLAIKDVIQLLMVGNQIVVAGLFWPLVLGILWKRANKYAALTSVGLAGGVTAVWYSYGYFVLHNSGHIGGIHAITVGFVLSLVIMLVGGLFTKGRKSVTSLHS